MLHGEINNFTLKISGNRLLVITIYDDNLLICLDTMDVTILPEQGVCRSGFTYLYDEKKDILYTMAGLEESNRYTKKCL